MATEVKLPELGENIDAGDVIKVLVAVGDDITLEQPILEIETDKAALEVPAPVSGTVEAIHVKVGDVAKVGQPVLTVNENGARKAKKPPSAAPQKQVVAPEPKASSPAAPSNVIAMDRTSVKDQEKQSIPAAPSARRRARELGVDISQVKGSGPGGKIAVADVQRHALAASSVQGGATVTQLPITLPDFSKWGEIRLEPMTNVRRHTAENLSKSWPSLPQVTHYDKADVTELEQLRKQHGAKAEAAGGKLTVTALLLKVIAAALREFPKFNASIDLNNRQIIYKEYIHIGIAVDTERGLLVPVIRDVDKKELIELAVELTEISTKARNKKLKLDEMQGGNFTISNLGGIGGTNFSPIVNAPEVAILGVSRGQIEPRFYEGSFVPRTMLPLALSYDHRLIDGADAARFLRWVVERLEQPTTLLG